MSLKSEYEDMEIVKFLSEGGIPVYKETAGKDMEKYKILGLVNLSFETEELAKKYYVDNKLFLSEKMWTEINKYD